MEALKSYYRDVEETYNELVSSASRAASYAADHSEIEYDGDLITTKPSLHDHAAYELLEDALVNSQNLSLEMHDSINRLSKEMEFYRENEDEIPQEYYELGDKLGRIRDQFHSLDREITELMKKAEKTEREEIQKQKSVIGNQEANKLTTQIPFEPKR